MKDMEELLELLEEVRDDIDFANSDGLIDDGILESFDIIQIVAAINETFDVEIPALSIIPENFNSAQAMMEMIERLQDE